MGQKTVRFEQLPEEIDKIYDNLMKENKKTRVKTTREAGQYMIVLAKKFSPYKSGDTQRGIRGMKQGRDYLVMSSVPNAGFAQNVWADNRLGYLGTKGKDPYIKHQKTGVSGGGFFTKAAELTRKKFTNIVIKDISKWETVKQ